MNQSETGLPLQKKKKDRTKILIQIFFRQDQLNITSYENNFSDVPNIDVAESQILLFELTVSLLL